MKVQLISHNIQGLNSNLALDRTRQFYSDKLRNLDFFCIQEHKLRGNALSDLGFKLWRQADFFGCEATIGNQAAVGCGGIAILTAPKIKHLIHSKGTIGVNQA